MAVAGARKLDIFDTWDADELFDLGAFDRAPLAQDPFDHLVVPGFLQPAAIEAINRDYPALDSPGNVPVDRCEGGPAFDGLIRSLRDQAMARRFEQKFGVDLSGCDPNMTIRARCERTDGNIHTDHKTKVITVLLYFNRDWPHEGGRLRILRSATDMDDYAAEVEPAGGTLLAFRRTDHSYHGHHPFVGDRRTLQLMYSRGGGIARKVSSITKPIRRILNLS